MGNPTKLLHEIQSHVAVLRSTDHARHLKFLKSVRTHEQQGRRSLSCRLHSEGKLEADMTSELHNAILVQLGYLKMLYMLLLFRAHVRC